MLQIKIMHLLRNDRMIWSLVMMIMRFWNTGTAKWYILILCQASPTLNKCTKHSSNLSAGEALFGTPYKHNNLPILSNIDGKTFVIDVQVAQSTIWQTEEENSFLHNTFLWAAKGLNATMVDPWALSIQKYPWEDHFIIGHWWEIFPTCWEL